MATTPKKASSGSCTEKKEYFDTKEVLEMKINQLAEWLRQSRYCIAFTGAGVSTSTGISDFRRTGGVDKKGEWSTSAITTEKSANNTESNSIAFPYGPY